MKLIGKIILFLLLILSSVSATYYVAPNGSSGNPGTIGQPWTMSKANSSAMPGDIVYVLPPATGTTWPMPNPVNSGTTADGGGFITFIGYNPAGNVLTDSLARELVVIGSGSISRPYVVIKGFRLNGLGFATTANRDSVLDCTIYSGLWLDNQDYLYLYRNLWVGSPSRPIDFGWGIDPSVKAKRVMDGLEFVGNRIWNCGTESNGCFKLGTHVRPIGSADPDSTLAQEVDSLTFRFNRIHTFKYGTGNANVKAYELFNSEFKYNYWDLINDINTNYIFGFRGRVRNVTVKDTLIGRGSGGHWIEFAHGGYGGSDPLLVGITFDSSYVKLTNGWFNFNVPLYNFKMTYTSVISGTNTTFYELYGISGKTTLNHNTFVSPVGSPVIRFQGDAAWSLLEPNNLFEFTNNIVAHHGTGTSHNICDDGRDNGIYWPDSTYRWHKRLTTNYNLYHIPSVTGLKGISDYNGNRSISYFIGSRKCDKVGTGEDFDNINTVTGGDSLSLMGDPLFGLGTQQTFKDNQVFDTRLGYGSPAFGNGSGASDIGAVAATLYGAIIFPFGGTRTMKAVQNDTTGVLIKNVGSGNLVISSVTSSDGTISFNWTSQTVGAGNLIHLSLTNNSSSTVNREVIVTLVTNDILKSNYTIPVNITKIMEDFE